MRGMILAAGLGTRLRPLTFSRPKVLIPLGPVTMLDFWVERLSGSGFESAVVNAFHLKELVAGAVSGRRWPIPVVVRPEPVLLGTGGGIRGALDFLGTGPFAAVNGDTVCDARLDELMARHRASGASVSLLMHDWPEFNNVAVEESGAVAGFGKEAQALARSRPGVRLLAFTGIHFMNPEVMAVARTGIFMDILDIYRDRIRAGDPPRALFQEGLFWREMGSVQSYRGLLEELAGLEPGFLPPLSTGRSVWVHPEARIAPGAALAGVVCVGKGSRVPEGCWVEDTILWDGVTVEPGSSLRRCVAADGARVRGRHEDGIFAETGR